MEETNTDFKRKLIDTFKAFDCFCKGHEIRYFICGGTLIGAVRHKGMIPWDDDVDVCMLPDDFERFCSFRGKIEGHYDIMDYRDENYWLLSLAKFVDVDTTLWEVEEYPCVTGVYIDIFPIYECRSEVALQQKLVFDNFSSFFRRSMRHYCLRKLISPLYRGNFYILKEIVKDLLYYKPMHKFYKRKFDVFYRKIKSEHGDCYVSYGGDYGKGEIFKKEWFNEVIKMKFEDMEVDAPKEYDKILTQLYGNYMQLPPKEKQISNHPHYFLDINRKWTIDEIKDYKRNHKTKFGRLFI